jgi:hypothetical protein
MRITYRLLKVKMDISKKYMNWIDLAQKMDEWLTIMNTK